MPQTYVYLYVQYVNQTYLTSYLSFQLILRTEQFFVYVWEVKHQIDGFLSWIYFYIVQSVRRVVFDWQIGHKVHLCILGHFC